jgi:hypothetical protein
MIVERVFSPKTSRSFPSARFHIDLPGFLLLRYAVGRDNQLHTHPQCTSYTTSFFHFAPRQNALLPLTISGAISEFHAQDGTLILKLVWPTCEVRSCTVTRGTQMVNWNTWKQTSDPFRSAVREIAGYTPIDVSYADRGNDAFGGLVRSASSSTLLDGQPLSRNW